MKIRNLFRLDEDIILMLKLGIANLLLIAIVVHVLIYFNANDSVKSITCIVLALIMAVVDINYIKMSVEEDMEG